MYSSMKRGSVSSRKPPRSYAAPALSRGLRILEVLTRAGTSLTLSEIARATGHSPAGEFRMLAVLEKEGYLRREADGSYRPTLKMFLLGRMLDPVRSLLAAADQPMREFCRATGQECHLSVLEHGQLAVLAQQSGTAPVTIRVRAGSTHDPRRTASGRLLLAGLPADEAAGQLRLAAASFRGRAPSAASLRRSLNEIARLGFARADGESRAGLRDLVVPVAGAGAALACSHFPAPGAGDDSSLVLKALQQAARKITAGLTGEPG
jgi:DNA-binding IclR family transcriptional regulator